MPIQTGGKRKVRYSSSKKSSSKKRTRSVSRKSKTVRRKNTKRKSTKKTSLNPWQRFLKKHGGKGHSLRTLRTMYRRGQK